MTEGQAPDTLVERLRAQAAIKDSNAEFNHGWGNLDGSLLREAASALSKQDFERAWIVEQKAHEDTLARLREHEFRREKLTERIAELEAERDDAIERNANNVASADLQVASLEAENKRLTDAVFELQDLVNEAEERANDRGNRLSALEKVLRAGIGLHHETCFDANCQFFIDARTLLSDSPVVEHNAPADSYEIRPPDDIIPTVSAVVEHTAPKKNES